MQSFQILRPHYENAHLSPQNSDLNQIASSPYCVGSLHQYLGPFLDFSQSPSSLIPEQTSFD